MKFKKRYIQLGFTIVILTGMFSGLLSSYLHKAPKRNYCDFRVYYATGQRFLAKADIYARPDEAITPFKYSPAFAMCFVPLALVSQKTASVIFFTINFFAMLFALMICKRMIVRSPISFGATVLLYGLTGLVGSRFLLNVLSSGQVTIIMFFLIIAGLYCVEKKREAAAGAIIALSVMIKYTSAVFLPYFVVRRRRSIAILVLIFAVLFCLLPAIHVGLDREAQYLRKWLPFISETSLDRGSWFDYKNQSLFSMVLRFTSKDAPYNLAIAPLAFTQSLGLGLILAAILYGLILFKKGKNNYADMADYCLLFICMALFNPNAWMSNFTFLIPGYMLIIYYLMKIRGKDIAILILFVFSFALGSWGSESAVGEALEDILNKFSTITFSGLLLMAALFRLKWKKGIETI